MMDHVCVNCMPIALDPQVKLLAVYSAWTANPSFKTWERHFVQPFIKKSENGKTTHPSLQKSYQLIFSKTCKWMAPLGYSNSTVNNSTWDNSVHIQICGSLVKDKCQVKLRATYLRNLNIYTVHYVWLFCRTYWNAVVNSWMTPVFIHVKWPFPSNPCPAGGEALFLTLYDHLSSSKSA